VGAAKAGDLRLGGALAAAALAILLSLLTAAAFAGTGPGVKATIPSVVSAGGLIEVSGRVRGASPAAGLRIALAERSGRTWRVATRHRLAPSARFLLRWQAPTDAGLAVLRVELLKRGRVLAGSSRRTVRIVTPAVPASEPRSGATAPPPAAAQFEPLPPPPLPTETTLPGEKSVISDGGPLTISLGGLTIAAPAGAIAAGQTMWLSEGNPPSFAQGPPSLGVTYYLGTSQGEPSAPVQVTFTYAETALQPGSKPLILHGLEGFAAWFPEETTVDGAARTASATLDTFSPIQVADSAVYYGGLLTGNRTDLPDDCGGYEPSWITDVSLPYGEQQPLPVCVAQGSSESQLKLSIANNRGYAMLISIGGAAVDVDKSWFGDSLEQQFAVALAEALPADGPQMFVLAPGGHATLTFDKPPDQPASREVYIDPTPKAGSSAFAAIAWSLLATARDEIGEPAEAANCVIGSLGPVFVGGHSVGTGIDAIRHCGDVAAGFSGTARKAFKKLAYGLTVDDFFYKVQDLEFDVDFPASIGFTVLGTGLVDDDMHISPLDLGVLPAGQPTVQQLSAEGGAPPYEFHVSASSANAGAVPSWVTLTKSGLLTIDPPAGTQKLVKFGVYAFDADHRHNPFNREAVKFRVGTAGGVWAWGDGQEGELGTPTASSGPGPVPIDGLGEVVEVAGTAEAVYALRADGTVWAWGSNQYGELGNAPPGEGCDPDYPEWGFSGSCGNPTPTQVQGLTGIDQIAGGHYSGYALRDDGTVWSIFGGDGEHSQIASLSGVKEIAAGSGTGYALLADGTVRAWGEEGVGQLGIGYEVIGDILLLPGCPFYGPCYSSTPRQVVGLTEVTAIAAGASDGYALRADGTVWAWGDNRYNQVGQGGITTGYYETGCNCFYPSPVRVQGLSGVDAIAAGERTAFALGDGHVWAWGDNTWGALGNGTVATIGCSSGTGEFCDSGVPLQVPGLAEISEVAAGGGYGNQFNHVLALGLDGHVRAWGADDGGQTGESSRWSTNLPHLVEGLPSVASIGAGGATSYAVAAAP
jgi:alpha-tubulin suppressor-like RCC1 family protein